MSYFNRPNFNRRSVLKSSLALLAGGALGRTAEAAAAEPAIKNVNLNSSPSTLKITDMRYAVVVKPGPSPCVLIRIDTNQGVYGLGEAAQGWGNPPMEILANWLFEQIKVDLPELFPIEVAESAMTGCVF